MVSFYLASDFANTKIRHEGLENYLVTVRHHPFGFKREFDSLHFVCEAEYFNGNSALDYQMALVLAPDQFSDDRNIALDFC